ncbi:hypothetical protein L2E82_26076 [Cichorium intybus]|uniref:Uncharacterized protein n=1 Tax=Cichorium intybus TaxID=13427 RepID=A0ACB9E5E2_CICIN|nr:hypothetical protein L2E82_26076 [Cichorium intybus]
MLHEHSSCSYMANNMEAESGTDGAVVTFSSFTDEGDQRWLDGRIDLWFLKKDWCLVSDLVTDAMVGGGTDDGGKSGCRRW